MDTWYESLRKKYAPEICPLTLNPKPDWSLMILIVLGCLLASSVCSRFVFCIIVVLFCEICCSINLLLFWIKLAILFIDFMHLSVYTYCFMQVYLLKHWLKIVFSQNKIFFPSEWKLRKSPSTTRAPLRKGWALRYMLPLFLSGKAQKTLRRDFRVI